MATLETARVQTGSPLDRIHNDVVFNGKEINPTFFSMLLNLVKIKDEKFSQLMKILTHSCSLMQQNPPGVIRNFFQSEGFFKQFIHINMIIDEIWMLRKEYPVKLVEWKQKHKQIFQFRSKLLSFLEKIFSRQWAQNLKEKAEMQRIRLWPLGAADGRK